VGTRGNGAPTPFCIGLGYIKT